MRLNNLQLLFHSYFDMAYDLLSGFGKASLLAKATKRNKFCLLSVTQLVRLSLWVCGIPYCLHTLLDLFTFLVASVIFKHLELVSPSVLDCHIISGKILRFKMLVNLKDFVEDLDLGMFAKASGSVDFWVFCGA